MPPPGCRRAFNRQGGGWHYELLQGSDAVLRPNAIGVELKLEGFCLADPMVATDVDDFAVQATLAPAHVSRIAEIRCLSGSRDVEAVFEEMDASECQAAVMAIVGLVGTPSTEELRSVPPERLHNRRDAALNATGQY